MKTIIPMMDTLMTVSAMFSGSSGKNSEIDSLTRRVKQLAGAIEFWNCWMLWGLLAAAVAAALILITTRLIVIRSKQLSAAQAQLDSAKDRQLQVDLKNKDVKIGELQTEADTAKGRIASAQAEAASADLLAEQERLARVRIEKQLAPRTLNPSDIQDIAEKVRGFATGLTGRQVELTSYSGDAEGIVFSIEIWNILDKAGIPNDPVIGRLVPVGLVDTGLKITGPAADQEFMQSLAYGIKGKCDTDIDVEWGDKYKKVTIAVGEKPVAGLPTVIPRTAK